MTEFQHNELMIVKQLPDVMQQVYYAWKVIEKLGGNGSIEIHFAKGRIKEQNGLYLKPGLDSGVLKAITDNGGI